MTPVGMSQRRKLPWHLSRPTPPRTWQCYCCGCITCHAQSLARSQRHPAVGTCTRGRLNGVAVTWPAGTPHRQQIGYKNSRWRQQGRPTSISPVSVLHTHTPQKRCRHQSPDVLTLISSVDKLHGLCRSRRQAGGNERRPHVHCHDDVPAPAMGCRKCTSEFAIVRDTAMDDGPTYRCCERRALTHTYTY